MGVKGPTKMPQTGGAIKNSIKRGANTIKDLFKTTRTKIKGWKIYTKIQKWKLKGPFNTLKSNAQYWGFKANFSPVVSESEAADIRRNAKGAFIEMSRLERGIAEYRKGHYKRITIEQVTDTLNAIVKFYDAVPGVMKMNIEPEREAKILINRFLRANGIQLSAESLEG